MRAVNIEGGRFAPPIASEVDPDRHSLVAELAFELLRSELDGGTVSAKVRVEATERVKARVARLAGIDLHDIPDLNPNEREEVSRLKKSLKGFLEERRPLEIIVSPKIPGCGIVQSCAADLLLRGRPNPLDRWLSEVETAPLRLIEVKSVERSFRAVDFRQLITYAALMSAAGERPEAVGLVNPRRGTFFECTTAELAMDTAGVGSDELLQQLVFDVSATDLSF